MNICPICDAQNTRVIFKHGRYDVCRCRECKLIFGAPLPGEQELMDYYQGFMFAPPDLSDITRLKKNKKKELARLFGLRGNEQGKTLLDHGGGTGLSWISAKETGFDAYYLDPDQVATRFVADNFGLTAEKIVTDLGAETRTFDYILSDNVVEHVTDPAGFIRHLYDKLAPGGKLVIKTPRAANLETLFNPLVLEAYFSATYRELGIPRALKCLLIDRFWHCMPPRHIYSFSPRSAVQLCINAGIPAEKVHFTSYSTGWFEYSLTRLLLKPRRFSFNMLLRKAIIASFVPFELLAKPFQVLFTSLGLISRTGMVINIVKEK